MNIWLDLGLGHNSIPDSLFVLSFLTCSILSDKLIDRDACHTIDSIFKYRSNYHKVYTYNR